MGRKGHDNFDFYYAGRYRFDLDNFNTDDDETTKIKGKDHKPGSWIINSRFITKIFFLVLLFLLILVLETIWL